MITPALQAVIKVCDLFIKWIKDYFAAAPKRFGARSENDVKLPCITYRQGLLHLFSNFLLICVAVSSCQVGGFAA